MNGKLLALSLLLLGAYCSANGQSASNDSSLLLNPVIVRAYQHERALLEVPASVSVITESDFERFNNASLLPVINAVPGVRMEERSPGSYRLSVRGSTLRSPFGLRNVKVYWNGLPFTDPGGNTYINLLDFGSLQAAEIIKGPGGSLYGAGTGGVLLMQSEAPVEDDGSALLFSATVGSFGSLRYTGEARTNQEGIDLAVRYAHQHSDGWREQTAMGRDAIQILGTFRPSTSRTVDLNVVYSDLTYETPGGLTEAEFKANPRQARPSAGPNPGAVEQHAAVFNKTFYSGVSHHYRWNSRWSNSIGVYGSFSQFDNSAIRNYERRRELSIGGRTNTSFAFRGGKLDFGAEFQHGFSSIGVYDNNQGQSGAIQNDDEIVSSAAFVFSQIEFFLPHDFFLTAGGSVNLVDVRYQRLSDVPPFSRHRDFDPVFSPRIALLKKISDNISVHASVSKGFSPPTVAELYPSTSTFNDQINPEEGTNYELGVRGRLLNNSLMFDIVGYDFRLDETIVVRRTDDDADYFVNAGKTTQRGMEVALSWQSLTMGTKVSITPWLSYTLNRYRFSEYIQDVNDYSGNKLTGVAPNILVGGITADLGRSWLINVNCTYTDRIPLNDANSAFADPYTLLGARVEYRFRAGNNFPLQVFAGAENILDETYSLGHDLNAFGNRFYNPAPPLTIFAGVKGSLNFSPRQQ
ncbi:MAG: TonB-dependent receptor [Bacteroidota bacterium]|jgi:iron complex outermembrane receptor protein|nr:MAG: TonB-dependent receptor [Bacteroidota bacterium]